MRMLGECELCLKVNPKCALSHLFSQSLSSVHTIITRIVLQAAAHTHASREESRNVAHMEGTHVNVHHT